MKARTKFEKWVAASNEKLTAISSKSVEWAVRNVLEHIAFRTSCQKCTCSDCGKGSTTREKVSLSAVRIVEVSWK